MDKHAYTAATSVAPLCLDYGAATPLDSDVLAAMMPYLTEQFWNPSAPYGPAREVRAAVERARAEVAQALGGKPDGLVFTAGATEANNLALASAPGEVICSAVEHDSVLAWVRERGGAVAPVSGEGIVDVEQLASLITPATGLISLALASAEVGCVQPLREVAAVVARERTRRLEAGETRPLYLHTDASQALGRVSVQVSSLGVDLLTLSAAKVYGPKQMGALWAGEGVRLRPLVLGGGQESGLRSGTENVAGIVGMAAAVAHATKRRKSEAARLVVLCERLVTGLKKQLPEVLRVGPANAKRRLPGVATLVLPGHDARRLVVELERKGVMVGTGSACAASRMKVSSALTSIGLSEDEARASLRVSLGHPTTEADIDYAIQAFVEVVRAEEVRTAAREVRP